MIPALRKLLSHVAWADQSVLTALQQAGDPPKELLEIFSHILGAEHVWLARLEGRTPSVAVWPNLDLDQSARLAQENRTAYLGYVGRLTEEGLRRLVHYRNSAGLEFDSTVEDILLHVCLHGSYHRGQVTRAIRQGGQVPIPTDYIGFVRGTPAATRE